MNKELIDTMEFVLHAHSKQTRKFTQIPYGVHPIDVMKTVAQFGVTDVDTLNASLLHDVVEDTKFDEEDIKEMYGKLVAMVVMELTCPDRTKEESKKEYKQRKADYIASFKKTSVVALVIKVADRVCNCRDALREGRPEHASKRFSEANELWEAFAIRTEEIQQGYGATVVLRMGVAIQQLRTIMYNLNF